MNPHNWMNRPTTIATAIPFPPRSKGVLSIKRVVWLRWVAIAAKVVTIAGVSNVWRIDLPIWPLLGVFSLELLSNLWLYRRSGAASEHLLGSLMVFDVLMLTALLMLTGGPANPFSVLYLVSVMLAAIVSSMAWAWIVVGASSAGFAAMFFFYVPLPVELGGHSHHQVASGALHSYSAHLQGMWLAYAVAAGTIATFVSRLSLQLLREREEKAQHARLLGLATLAAGAAHEIGNPLATIRIVASELERELAACEVPKGIRNDLRLMNDEVTRAERVLRQMATGAGELAGECPATVDPETVIAEAASRADPVGNRVIIRRSDAVGEVRWPIQAVVQALTQIVRNGLQASPSNVAVNCELSAASHGIAIRVSDAGCGMSQQIIARIGEPFFTTRPDGTGLGVFIAQTLFQRLGGSITFRSQVGKGTMVDIWLPAGVV